MVGMAKPKAIVVDLGAPQCHRSISGPGIRHISKHITFQTLFQTMN